MHSRVKDFWSITPSEIAGRFLTATPVITLTLDNASDIGVCLGLSLGPPAIRRRPVETRCISIPLSVVPGGIVCWPADVNTDGYYWQRINRGWITAYTDAPSGFDDWCHKFQWRRRYMPDSF